jgi:hypothetical protein
MVLTDCLGFLFGKNNFANKKERHRALLLIFGKEKVMDPPQNLTRVTRSAAFDLEASPSEAFVLFGPDREGDWAWGWQPEPVYPAEIRAEEGAVFRTKQHGEEVVWVVSRYDLNRNHVEYTTFRHADRVGLVSVVVSAQEGGSQVKVTYTFTALSEQGRRFIAQFTEEKYERMMADWERAIRHFLETGETLRH